jgi:hypothetical protein
MLKSFESVFPSKSAWNAPHHMDFLEPRSVKFHYSERRSTNYLGLCEIEHPAKNLLESARSWSDWEEVQIYTQRNLDEPHSFGFKNKKTGGHLFLYFHEAFGKKVVDMHYIDGKYNAAIQKFIGYGFFHI